MNAETLGVYYLIHILLFYLIIVESQAQLTFIRPQMIFHKIRILKDNLKYM